MARAAYLGKHKVILTTVTLGYSAESSMMLFQTMTPIVSCSLDTAPLFSMQNVSFSEKVLSSMSSSSTFVDQAQNEVLFHLCSWVHKPRDYCAITVRQCPMSQDCTKRLLH